MEPTYEMRTLRDIRRVKWYEEIEEYFNLDRELLEQAVPRYRKDSEEVKQAKKEILSRFMSKENLRLYEKVITGNPKDVSDKERSESWKKYVLVCITGERRRFKEMCVFDKIIHVVIKPLLKKRKTLIVVDYGCGSSLFTRMISQDFRGRVQTVSADVCRYSVEFSTARNQLHNPSASGILIEDVNDVLALKDVDVILARYVFEHLPNATKQIQGLLDSLKPGGILIENYAGHSLSTPHKSDTFDSYQYRDHNLNMLNEQMELLYGMLPEKENGIYIESSADRFWIKPVVTENNLVKNIKKKLARKNIFYVKRKIYDILYDLT